jgi:Xaa-Pro aminopeptidase
LRIDKRLKQLRRKLAEEEIEAILISRPESRRYLSGFDGSAGLLLITQQDTVLATDFRYLEQAQKQAPDYKIIRSGGETEKWLARLLGELNLGRLGFEADHVSYSLHRRLARIPGKKQLRLIPSEGLVDGLRAVKEPAEVELITRAAAISDAAFEEVAANIQAGMTEQDVAWAIEKSLHEKGSQSVPFDIMVASGPNAAMPHAKPLPRPIQPGEPVLVDFGAKIDGYSSDLSRTICLGQPDDNFKRLYDTVFKARSAAIAGTAAGMTGKQADGLARKIISEAGYGDNFGHGLGHGLGLATHERPYLSPGSPDHLADGMVFTIEPGIYIAGWGGIRIEDTVVMENGKIKVLSRVKNIQGVDNDR